MYNFALWGVAVGLAMDAFSVSLAKGIAIKEVKHFHAFKVAFYFGVFQGLMPLIGWLIGSAFSEWINSFSHWIAFALLTFLGLRMIIGTFTGVKCDGDKCEYHPNSLSNRTLTLLAIATSIDALLVGFTIESFKVPVLLAIAIIGAVTFAFCFVGVWIGSKIGSHFNRYAGILGGILLIAIGAFMLYEGLK